MELVTYWFHPFQSDIAIFRKAESWGDATLEEKLLIFELSRRRSRRSESLVSSDDLISDASSEENITSSLGPHVPCEKTPLEEKASLTQPL